MIIFKMKVYRKDWNNFTDNNTEGADFSVPFFINGN